MERIKSGGAVYEFIKGLIISVIFSLLGILIFAAVIRFVGIDSGLIPIINQVIKSLSILVGVLSAFTKRPNGWLRGFIFGVLFALLSYLIFSLLSGSFGVDVGLLNDVVLGGVTGLISGIIAVNVKKARN